ncbi:MAG: hypothetical protein WCD89_26270 [Anaerocolumna sp.]
MLNVQAVFAKTYIGYHENEGDLLTASKISKKQTKMVYLIWGK